MAWGAAIYYIYIGYYCGSTIPFKPPGRGVGGAFGMKVGWYEGLLMYPAEGLVLYISFLTSIQDTVV
jgi:hypothetical protein